MTEEQIALARRAVACEGWRWMPGMCTDDGFRVCRVDTDGYKFGYRVEYNYAYAVIGDVLPDLEDPATLGCLLALVREAWGDPMAAYTCRGKYTPDMVYVDLYHVDQNGPCRGVAGFGSTEPEALVHALENAR